MMATGRTRTHVFVLAIVVSRLYEIAATVTATGLRYVLFVHIAIKFAQVTPERCSARHRLFVRIWEHTHVSASSLDLYATFFLANKVSNRRAVVLCFKNAQSRYQDGRHTCPGMARQGHQDQGRTHTQRHVPRRQGSYSEQGCIKRREPVKQPRRTQDPEGTSCVHSRWYEVSTMSRKIK